MIRKHMLAAVLLSFFFSIAGSSHAAARASALKLGMDSLFSGIKQDFDSIAASSIVRKKETVPVDGYFFSALKKHQPYYALAKTDSKGTVINEVIRMVEKPSTKKQNVSRLPWFKYVRTNFAEYRGLIKIEETGRYYLFWAAPIINKSQKKGSRGTFLGAVTIKVDLWDCFCEFSKNAEVPFLIRVNKMRLYSNKWKDTIAYKEELLKVPGVKRVLLRSPRIIAAAAKPADTQVVLTVDSSLLKAAAADSLKKAKTLKSKKHSRAVLGGIVILLIIIIIVYFISVLRSRMIEWRIDKLK